jgi:hypothetical protein
MCAHGLSKYVSEALCTAQRETERQTVDSTHSQGAHDGLVFGGQPSTGIVEPLGFERRVPAIADGHALEGDCHRPSQHSRLSGQWAVRKSERARRSNAAARTLRPLWRVGGQESLEARVGLGGVEGGRQPHRELEPREEEHHVALT